MQEGGCIAAKPGRAGDRREPRPGTRAQPLTLPEQAPPWPDPADFLLSAMLPRPLRLLLDTNPPGGVVLSSFRSRDPEEGGDPGGRAVGGGQEEEDEEEEEVRRGWREAGH